MLLIILCLGADGHDLVGLCLYRDDAGFVKDDLVVFEDYRVSRAEVNGQFLSESEKFHGIKNVVFYRKSVGYLSSKVANGS